MFLPRTRSARFPRRARARGPPGGWGSARRPSGACWRCPGRSTQQGTNSAFEGRQCNRQRPADESTQLGRRGAPSARGSSGRPWCQSSRSGFRKEPLATEGSPVRNETKLPQAAKAGSACPQSTCRLSGTPTTALPLQKGVSARVAAQRLPWTDTGAASPSARAQSQQSPRMKGKYCAPLSLSSPGVIDPGPVTEMPVIFAFRPHPCNPTASPARAALRKHQPFPSMDKLEQK